MVDGAAERGGAAGLREGLRLYCIGDIHGRSDLLARVRDAICAHLAHSPIRESAIICLGDYIDRGPDSAGVLDLLSGDSFPAPLILLRGNHEIMLESFLRDSRDLGAWRRFGALETLASYGVETQDVAQGLGYEAARLSLAARLPIPHRELLDSLRSSVTIDGFFFCHAGVRPGVPLDAQDERDLLWIRDEFLSWPGDFGKIIVHGHTPVAEAEMLPNRINIDTGAFKSGRLTCLVLEDQTYSFLTGG